MSDFSVRWNSGARDGFTTLDHYQTIVSAINNVSAAMHSKTLKGGGDTLEVAPNVMEIIEYVVYYDRHRGILGGRYKVIVDEDLNSVIKISSTQHNITGTVLVDGMGEIIEGGAKKNFFYLLIK